MAARSQRRKKGQGAAQDIRDRPDIRERPFTAFGEDPNTSLLVPTPSEQAGPSAGQMSSPFSVASSSGGHNTTSTNNTTPNGNYQPGNYAYPNYGNGNGNGNGNDSNMTYDGGHTHAQQQHQLNSSVSLPTMPTGRSDLEILERLKAQIKAGQHERFQPKPMPGALLKIYQDGIKSQAAPHPQQGPDGNAAAGSNQHRYDARSAPGETGLNYAPAHDASRRVPPIHTPPFAYDSKRPVESSPASASQATIKVTSSPYRPTHKYID